MFRLREYQQRASDAAVHALLGAGCNNGLLILPTGAGKSLVIADIASRMDGPLLVLQPTKEILEQNYGKLLTLGVDAGIFSASAGSKEIRRITLAMIGSVMHQMPYFNHFKRVVIDECHLVNATAGQYKRFIEASERRVIGLTATPYRLHSFGQGMSMLKFLTRTRPRIFTEVLYQCQVAELVSKGYLSTLNYYDITAMDMRRVRSNSTGADYDERSLCEEYERSGFYTNLVNTVERLLRPKSGVERRGILVFTRFVREATLLSERIRDCVVISGETKKADREAIIDGFRSGRIKVVANAGVLTTGFDYPELDTIVMARPTKSLALWYQIVGRAIRPSPNKVGWIVDMCGTYRRFGRVEDLRMVDTGRGKWCVMASGRQLTNIPL